MRALRTVLLGAGGLALIAGGGAMAADPTPVVADMAAIPVATGCSTSGYVSTFAAAGKGHFYLLEDTFEVFWRELGFGGAGRAAIQCGPSFSFQLDAWADHWSGVDRLFEDGEPIDEFYYSGIDMGVAKHLTYRSNGFLGGVMLSLGADDDWGTFATSAAEAAFNTANLRVQGQVGVTKALFGEAADNEVKDIYAQAVLAFYPNPGLSISGTLGFDLYTDNDPDFEKALNWGARAEFQLPGRPVSLYVAYQGWHWRGSEGTADFDEWAGMQHQVAVGMRFLVGQPDVRSMDEAVGLADYNQLYGLDFPN